VTVEVWAAVGVVAAAIVAVLAVAARLARGSSALTDLFGAGDALSHAERLEALEAYHREHSHTLQIFQHVPARLNDLQLQQASIKARLDTLIELTKGKH